MAPVQSLAIVTESARMRAILARVDTIARSDTSVLLVGETGVGKELFADYIHRVSPRAEGPFVKIALSAMPHAEGPTNIVIKGFQRIRPTTTGCQTG